MNPSDQIMTDPGCPPGTIYFISPRRCERMIAADGTVVDVLEPLDQWARRCAVIKNLEGER